jgi:hypothetical protein
MPRHHIEISLPTKPLKNVDTTIRIWSGDEKLGEMRISKGSLDWVPAGAQKPRRISWEDLALLLNNRKDALKALRIRDTSTADR